MLIAPLDIFGTVRRPEGIRFQKNTALRDDILRNVRCGYIGINAQIDSIARPIVQPQGLVPFTVLGSLHSRKLHAETVCFGIIDSGDYRGFVPMVRLIVVCIGGRQTGIA